MPDPHRVADGPLTIRVLGPLTLLHNDQPTLLAPRSRPHALLACLLLHHQRPLDRAYLAGQFDPDLPDVVARRRLSDALYLLRRYIPGDRLRTTPTTLALALAADDVCDLLQIEQHLCAPMTMTSGSALLQLPEPIFCPELDQEWVLIARESLRLRFLNHLEQLAAFVAEGGDLSLARALLLRLLQFEPMRETAQVALLNVFARLGSMAEAAHQYDQWKQRLQRESGFSPEPETERCYQRLLQQAVGHRPHHQRLLPDKLPLVGRDAERRQLLGWMDQAGSPATLVLLEGMAGIGKSHLLEQLAEDATWRDWHVGSGTARGMGSAIEEALAGLLTPLQRAQVQARIAPVWWQRLVALFPEAPAPGIVTEGEMPSLPAPAKANQPLSYDSTADPERYHETLLRLLEALTIHAPLLLILDDMHVATDTDLALLPQIAALTTSHPLLVIISYRPSVREEPDRWRSFQRLDTLAAGRRLVLGPLSSDQCALLLRQTLGRFDLAALTRLMRFTEGHPLFLRETLNFLLESESLQCRDDGIWTFDPHDLDRAQVPDISRTVASRVSRLSPPDFDLLATLAIHNDTLAPAHLAVISGRSAAEIIERAQGLIRRHLVQATAVGYRCAHALIGQAVREMIAPDERRQRHGQLFDVSGQQPGIPPQQRGQHALAAERWAEALPLLMQASVEARARADYRAALQVLDQALQALEQTDLSAEQRVNWQINLLLERQQIWSWHPPAEPRQRAYDLALLERLIAPDHPLRIRWQIAQIDDLLDRGENQAALASAQQALAAATNTTDWHTLMRLHMQASKAAQRLDVLDDGITHLNRARELAEALGDIEAQVAALGNLAIYEHFCGNFAAARTGYMHVSQLCEQHGLIMAGLVATANLAALDRSQGNLAAAIAGYERSIAGCERYASADPPDFENLAEIYIQIGAFERAEALLARAEALWRERNGNLAFTRCRQATLAIARQHYDLARQWLQVALQLSLTSGDSRVTGEVYLWYGLIAIEECQFEAAEQALAEVSTIYGRMGVSFYDALIVALRAICAVRQGQAEHARQWVAQATAAVEQHIGTFVQPHYYLGIVAEILGAASDATTAYCAAWHYLQTQAATLPPELAERLLAAPFSQRVVWAMRRQEYRQRNQQDRDSALLVILPLKSAPTGRALHPWEETPVLWDLAAIDAAPRSRAARQAALRTLISQTHYQEAAPTLTALAQALQVSVATISRDLHELRSAGEQLLSGKRKTAA